jgi:hypothetical protein
VEARVSRLNLGTAALCDSAISHPFELFRGRLDVDILLPINEVGVQLRIQFFDLSEAHNFEKDGYIKLIPESGRR